MSEILVVQKKSIELHCVHNGGAVTVDLDRINEVRPILEGEVYQKKGAWTRLRMNGSPDVEVKEPYEQICAVVFPKE